MVQPLVTETMNSMLLKDFTREEVEIAMKQMEPITALGPNGMPSLFYQSFWTTVGDDVCSAILDFLHNCKILREINLTHIPLIPNLNL